MRLMATVLYTPAMFDTPWMQAAIVVLVVLSIAAYLAVVVDTTKIPVKRVIVAALVAYVLSVAIVQAQPVYLVPCDEMPWWMQILDVRCWLN